MLALLKQRRHDYCFEGYCGGIQESVMTVSNVLSRCSTTPEPKTITDDTFTTWEIRPINTGASYQRDYPYIVIHVFNDEPLVCNSGTYVDYKSIGLQSKVYHTPQCPQGYTLERHYWTHSSTAQPYGFACRPSYNTLTGEIPNSCKDYSPQGQGTVWNPVDLIDQCKQDRQVDLTTSGPYPIVWSRTYASRSPGRFWFFEPIRSGFGSVLLAPELAREQYLVLRRHNGALLHWKTSGAFTGTPRTFVPDHTNSGNNARLETRAEDWVEAGVWKGVKVINRSQEIEFYEALTGRLIKQTNAEGFSHLYTYNAEGLMTKIEDEFGHFIQIGYLEANEARELYVFQSRVWDPILQQITPETLNLMRSTVDDARRRKIQWVSNGTQDVLYRWDNWHNQTGTEQVVMPNYHLGAVTHANGGVTEYQYLNSNHALIEITDPTGKQRGYQYTTASSVAVSREWAGDGKDGLNPLGELRFTSNSITDQEGRVFGFTANSSHRRVTAYNGTCAWCNKDTLQYKSITYDSQGNPTSLTDFENRVERRTYDPVSHQMLTRTRAHGTPLATTETWTWDQARRLPLTHTQPVSRQGVVVNKTVTYTWDPVFALLLSETHAVPGEASRVWHYTYNAQRLLETVTDPTGRVTRRTYTPEGWLSAETTAFGTPLARTTLYTNHVRGKPGTITGADGTVLTLTWDEADQLTAMTRTRGPLSVTRTFEYDLAGRVLNETDGLGGRQTYEYDRAGRLVKVNTFQNGQAEGAWQYTLSLMGLIQEVKFVNAQGQTIWREQRAYDARARHVQALNDLNQGVTGGLNQNGEWVSQVDSLNRSQAWVKDALGRTTQHTDPLNGVSQFTYGPDDTLLTARDPKTLTTTYRYNGFGEVVQVISPDRGTTSLTRDAEGKVLTQTDARGVVTTWTYDELGRPLSQTTNVSGANGVGISNHQTITWTYDACANGFGQVCSRTDESGTTTWHYGPNGLPVEERWA